MLFDAAEGVGKLHALSAGLERTLATLDAEGKIQARHAALVERARYFAIRAETSGGIAATNWAKLYAEAEAELMALEPPPSEETDDAGNRITQLAAWLQEARRASGDVRDEAPA